MIQSTLDIYYIFHLEIPTTISKHYITHFISELFDLFAYIILATFLFFQATKEVSNFVTRRSKSKRVLKLYFIFVLVLEFVRIYNWSIEYYQTKFSFDLVYLLLMAIRFVGLVFLVYLTNKLENHIESLIGIDEEQAKSSWKDTMLKIQRLFPFLWPRDRYLQFLVVVCFGLLGLGRIVNMLVPYSYKLLVEDLSKAENSEKGTFPFAWLPILAYTFFRFLQGGVGALSSLQYFLWIPVGQFTTREISVRMLEHLHSLSLQFHISSKTGELLRVMDRGTSSIGSLLSYLCFNILPVFVDIFLAVIYCMYALDLTIALVVLVTMVLYIFFTVWITEWRTKFRRDMNELDTSARGRAVDSLLNFETVKYFGNEDWEVKEYEAAIVRYQVEDWKSSSSLNFLNTAQNIVITLGLLTGLLITGKRVYDHELSLGDFVFFVTYLMQLYQPLNWFGTYYRVIQQNFIDMEKMLDLFEENRSIKDAPDASEFELKRGSIVFGIYYPYLDNVTFSYDGQVQVLKNLSFNVPAGKTYALVGTSGGGKSSILRVFPD
jgi:ATP-binding cassette subfamily B (MDR/TAP) protein 6